MAHPLNIISVFILLLLTGIYEFQQLLAERAKFDKYVCWLKAMVIRSANSVHGKVVSQNIARNVVLELSYIIAIIAREINFDASNCVKSMYQNMTVVLILASFGCFSQKT